MERTSLLTKIIALSFTVICIASLASLAQIASSAAAKNEPEHTSVIALQEEASTANPMLLQMI